jgi:acetyl esterase
MPTEHSKPLVAELWLRGAGAPMRGRLSEPPARDALPLVVLVPGSAADAAVGDALAAVTLALPPVCALAFDDALAALGWAADHARELGARTGPLVLAGTGEGGALARLLAARAAAEGWPEIARVVLIPPEGALHAALADLAAAREGAA